MQYWKTKKVFKALAALTLTVFLNQQIAFSAELFLEINQQPSPVQSIEKAVEKPAEEIKTLENDTSFLSGRNYSPLSPAHSADKPASGDGSVKPETNPPKDQSGSEARGTERVSSGEVATDPEPLLTQIKEIMEKNSHGTDEAYELERYSFEDALDLLRPEYAAAVILKSISEEDIKTLTTLSFETAIAILWGEIVLFSTGNEKEIHVLKPAEELLEKSTFTSHVHVNGRYEDGPSHFDLEAAVEAPEVEYVITPEGAYGYNSEGVLNSGGPYSYSEFVKFLNKSLTESRERDGGRDQVKARERLNSFIHQMDLLNLVDNPQTELFRMAGIQPPTVSPLPAATNSSRLLLSGTKPANTSIWINGAEAVPLDSNTRWSYTASLSEERTYSFSILAKDTQGNESDPVVVSTTYDRTTPVNAIVSPTQDATASYRGFRMTGNASDSAGIDRLEVMVRSAAGTFQAQAVYDGASSAWYYDVPQSQLTPNSSLSLYSRARDKAGNYSGWLSVGVRIDFDGEADITAPVVAITTEAAVSSGFIFGGAISDDKSGVSEIRVYVYDYYRRINTVSNQLAQYDAVSGTWAFQVLPSHVTSGYRVQLRVRAKDTSNNWSNWQYRDLTVDANPNVDTDPPSVNITSPRSGGNVSADGFLFEGNIFDQRSAVAEVRIYVYDYGRSAYTVSNQLAGYDPSSGRWMFSVAANQVTHGYQAKLWVRGKDANGLWSPWQSIFVSVRDITPPIGTVIINGGAEYATSHEVTLDLSASDIATGVESMRFSLDEGLNWTSWEAYLSSRNITFTPGERMRSVRAQFRDRAGNTALTSDTITLDTVPPSGSILINNGADFTRSRAVTLALSASDTTSGISAMRFSLDGGSTWTVWEAFSSTKALDLTSGDGPKEVRYQLIDRAGLLSSYSDAITLDTTPPTFTITSPLSFSIVSEQGFTIQGTASDTYAGVSQVRIFLYDYGRSLLTVNNQPATYDPSSGTWQFQVTQAKISEGKQAVFWVRAEDSLGNRTGLQSRRVTVRDVTPPQGSISINNSEPFTNIVSTTLHLSATDAGSGINKMSFSSDGTNWTPQEPFSSTKLYTLPSSDGLKTVYVRYYDRQGNVSAVYSASITLDRTPPSGAVAINGGAAQTFSSDAVLTLSAEDLTSGIDSMRFAVEDDTIWTEWEPFSSEKPITLYGGVGERMVLVQLRDRAGNVSTFFDSILVAAGETVIEFLSPDTTSDSLYTLVYTVNSEQRQEQWRLNPGSNLLKVRVSSNGSVPGFKEHTVTLNQTEDPVPGMPAKPVPPANLVSLSTDTGLVVKYSDGEIFSVEKTDEYELFLPEFGQDGGLTGGLLEFGSGARLLYKDGIPIYQISPDGEKTFYYADGSVRAVEHPEGSRVRFAYRYDDLGSISAVLSMEETVSSLYDAANIPVWIQIPDGTDIRYSEGILREYTDSSGNLFHYDITEIRNGATLEGYLSRLVSVTLTGNSSPTDILEILNNRPNFPQIVSTLEEKLAQEIHYDPDKEITKFISGKDEHLTLNERLPTSLWDRARGIFAAISAQISEEGDLSSVDWTNDTGLTQIFDGEGNLSGLRLSDGTAFEVTALTVDGIVLSDGSVLTNLVWNGSDLTHFLRKSSNGVEERYENSRLIYRIEQSGNKVNYIYIDSANRVDKITTPDGRVYQFIEYENSEGRIDRLAELTTVNLPDGSRIDFEHGRPVRYLRSKEMQLDPLEVPVLPSGESFVPLVEFPEARLRALTIDENANILSGEILFNDGTQYLIQNGEVVKQITPSGQFIEFAEEDLNPPDVPIAIPPEPLTQAESAYRSEIIETQLDFFVDGVGIHELTGLPIDNYRGDTEEQASYSQATLVGFWAEILSAAIRDPSITTRMTQIEAFRKLDLLLQSFRQAQNQAGFSGLVSFFTIAMEGGIPRYSRTFDSVGFGDNLNLLVSLSTVLGALDGISFSPEALIYRDRIIQTISTIITGLQNGFGQFYDFNTNRMRMVYIPSQNRFEGYMDRVFNEFRTGMFLFGTVLPFFAPAVRNLDVTVRTYTTADGQAVQQAVPFDGGAFQMFWPLIHVDETQFPEFDIALKNFLYAQAEFVKSNNIPGLLSAGDYPGSGYQGKIGLPSASETDDPLFTDVGSIYGTASAFSLAPHYALQFLKNIESRFPQIRTSAGFVDAIRFGSGSQPIFSSQYFGVDQASFILSFLGTSRGYFSRYLERNGFKAEFERWYKTQTLGLEPIELSPPSPPDFLGNTPLLYDGQSQSPDGRIAGLVKKQGLIPVIFDPEFGEGKIFNYFGADGGLRKTGIEFGVGVSLRRMDLQEYILLPGRAQIARSLSDGFMLDLLNAARAQGAFYTPDQGYANIAITSDPLLGEVRHLDYDLRALNRSVGAWAQFDNLDLSAFDYLSIPMRLSSSAPEGVRLKFELKGMGEVFVSPPLTHDWQYVHIPIVKPAGKLTEMAIVVQSMTGSPVSGDLFLGPLSAFKTRTSKALDWLAMLGKTDAEIRNLLKQQVLDQAGGGGFVEADEILEDFKVDSEGNLIEGVFKRADGSIQYFQNRQLNKWVFPNGRTILFEEGLAAFAIDLARGALQESRFYYDKTFQGEIRSLVLQDNDRKRTFGSDGKITTMVEGGNVIHFLDGQISSIETSAAVLTNLEFSIDHSLLRAHVIMNNGTEFDIDQTVEQVINLGNGVKIYYRGTEITAIETLQNGRTDFAYIYNAVSQLIGVNASFVDVDAVLRTLPLAEYILRPERTIEKEHILREAPVGIIDRSLMGGFSVGGLPPNEYTHGRKGNFGYDSKAWYGFRYQSPTGTILGMVADHRSLPVLISNYSFLALTIMQDPAMDWNQDFNLKLKTPFRQTLYAFEVDNTVNEYQTFIFPMAGKSGTEGEITLEVVREPSGVGKFGQVYIKDLSYLAVRTLNRPLWEDQIGITASLMQSLAIEAGNLTAVSVEIASGGSLRFDLLGSVFDIPTRMLYTETETGESKLLNFKRFDGSEVALEGETVKRITLPDGTVNEYDAGENAGRGTIQGPGGDLSDSGTLDYRYGALRQITQPDGRQFSLSYSFDENGEEITTLRDELLGEERRFKNGKLIDGLSRDDLKTHYSYENGKLIGAELLYKNRILDSTRFLFSGDETQVTDERGTTWFYDAKGNLTKHLTQDGFLYRYSKETIRLEGGSPSDPSNYKNAIFNATDLLGVHLLGYESQDGSQILYDFEAEGLGDIRLSSGDHGVNIAFDKERRIKSGQIQFQDGLIVEIENYTPVRGRLADGTFFEILLPASEHYEILQSESGAYLGFRLALSGLSYTYDTAGRLTKVESAGGRKDEFTYSTDAGGNVTQYIQRTITPVGFNGVPFPKEIDLITDGNLRFLDSGNEIARRVGSGFLVAVYNEALDIWDTYSGSFSSGGDRLGLTQFLNRIRPGSYVAAMVADSSFSSADEAILSKFESLGADRIRQAASGNQRWGFLGNESLSAGEGYEVLGANSVSSVTRSESVTSVGAGENPLFNGIPMLLYLPAEVSESYGQFLEDYERVRPADDTQKLTVYNARNEIVYTKRLDGVASYYEFGNVRETFDEAGALLSIHKYECPAGNCTDADDMKLKRITLVKARSDFEAESARLREQIEQTKFDALYRLAWQNEAARLQIKETVDSTLSQIDTQVADLESQRYVGVEFCKQGFFKRKCQTLPVEVPGVAEAIQSLLSQRSELLATAQEQLALIPGEVATKKQEIEQATQERMAEFETQEEEFILDVLRSEMEPIIADRYRRILGRDASRQEVESWIGRYRVTQEIDTLVLQTELLNSSEKAFRETQKAQIIQQVRTFLEAYLSGSLAVREALLLNLKLNAGEVVDLTAEDVEKIVSWLQGRDLHFGQSAFLSLKEMLASKGVIVSMEVLGYQAILIDILTGVIHRFSEGDLLLSAFALTRTAAVYGQHFSTVKYSFDDLLGFYSSRCPDPNQPCGLRMIARIGEDHFVVIVRVTSDEVVYREVVKGPEGEDITVSREKFIEAWQVKDAGASGYLIVSENELISSKQLTSVEAMQVKGSFLGFLFAFLWTFAIKPLIGFAVKFFSAVLGKLVGFTSMVNTIIGTVANLAGWIVDGVRIAFTQIAQSGFFESIKQGFAVIGKALLTPIKFVGRFIQKGFVFLKETFSNGLERLGTGIMRIKDFLLHGAGNPILNPQGQIIGHEFTFAQTVARNIVAAGLNYSATKGLESFGLPPSIARIGGAFVGSGFFGIGAQASSFLRSSLQGFLLQGVSEIGLKLNLPPPFTDGLSLLAGSALNAYFDPTLTLRQSVTQVVPQISQKLTLGGMDLLGRSLGWDARISRLLGLPFSAAVGGILGSIINPGSGPSDIWGSIRSSLFAETIHFGTQVLFNELNLSPMFNHFGLTLFSSISQGLLNASWNTSGNRGSEESIFSRISDNLARFGRALASGVGQVISFGAKVLEGGVGLVRNSFAKAVNFFSNLFSRDSQELLLQEGNGNIEEAIFNRAQINGNTAAAVIGNTQILWDGNANTLTLKEGSRTKTFFDVAIDTVGQFFSSRMAYAEEIEEGIFLNQSFQGNRLTDLSITGLGNVLFKAVASGPLGLVFDAVGNIVNGIFEIPQIFKIGVKEGEVDFVETEGKEGIFQSLLSEATDLLSKPVGFIYTAAEKVTLTLFDIVQKVLSPIGTALDTFYGKITQRNDKDLWTPGEIKLNTGIPADLTAADISEEERLTGKSVSFQLADGSTASGTVFRAGDWQNYQSRLPLELQARLTTPGSDRDQLIRYFEQDSKEAIIYFGDTTRVSSHYQEQFGEENLLKKLLLSDGDHDVIQRGWFDDIGTPEIEQQLIEGQVDVGLAQIRIVNTHLTDVYESTDGFLLIHQDDGANVFPDGFLWHIFTEVLPSKFKRSENNP